MKSPNMIVVPLAEGFEEIEAATIIDVLRRAGLAVTVAGLGRGPIRGAHGLAFATDVELAGVEAAHVRMVVLPGGMPGATNLLEDPRVIALLKAVHEGGQSVAAICAAPMVLARAGVLSGQEATAYPSFQDRLGDARVRPAARVVRSGRVWTSQGVGTALEFALALVEELCGAAKARQLASEMLVASS